MAGARMSAFATGARLLLVNYLKIVNVKGRIDAGVACEAYPAEVVELCAAIRDIVNRYGFLSVGLYRKIPFVCVIVSNAC